MTWWTWIVFGIVLFIFDIVTPWPVFLAFFGIGAAIVGVLASFGVFPEPWLEWFAFALISTILTYFLLPKFSRRKVTGYGGGTNDDFIGQTAVARGSIPPGEIGQIELRGTHWSARNVGTSIIAEQGRCTVKARTGLTLEVEN